MRKNYFNNFFYYEYSRKDKTNFTILIGQKEKENEKAVDPETKVGVSVPVDLH